MRRGVGWELNARLGKPGAVCTARRAAAQAWVLAQHSRHTDAGQGCGA